MNRVITSASESVSGHEKFIHFYCVKCRDHFKSNDYEPVTFKNGKHALKSKCETCGTASYIITKGVK
jgi:hypothetical protein